jgi:hypothetical protein
MQLYTFTVSKIILSTKTNFMSFLDRFSNGWTITINSFKVLKANKELIIFPILSAVSMILIMGSFVTAILASVGWNMDYFDAPGTPVNYVFVFLYYLVNYFIVVFFNMALIHCTRLYFKGEEVNIAIGLRFSLSRIGVIFSWAVFAATVGTLLRLIQENVGWIGKIITGLIGIVWSITTFFVVPVLAYEKLGPIDAFKRSTKMMKEKWGESLGSSFSFGLINFIAALAILAVAFVLGSFIHLFVGIAFGVLALLFLAVVMSATQTIFVSAVYHNITDEPVKYFNQQLVDSLFTKK